MKNAIASVVVLSTFAAAAAAQDAPPAVTAGDKIRMVETGAGAGRFTAVVVDVRKDALLVRTAPDAPPRLIPLSGLRRLDVARGRRGRVKEGALIGFVPGFVLGAYAGNVIGCDDQGPDCTDVGAAAGAGLMLGGVTALAGGLVGLAIRTDRWQGVPLPANRSTRLAGAVMPVRGGWAARFTVAF